MCGIAGFIAGHGAANAAALAPMLARIAHRGPDGRAVLPAFTSVAAMQAWNTDARPVPIQASKVASAAR